ncbi:MAG: c-type cytochrome [Flavitalea sp.]
MKVLKVTGIIILVLIVLIASAGLYVKTALPNTGPAPEMKIERTPQRLHRGEYLANSVAVCMDCHSTRDWAVFAGPLKPGNFGGGGEAFDKKQGFPGNFYAPNITPAGIGEWSDGEVFRAVTTGVSKDGRALFPVMGYHRFGQMDEEDVKSIIAYIRSLPTVDNKVPVSEADFPVNFIINTMPHKANFKPMPDSSNAVAYGGYLVNVAGCVDCHSKTDKGAIIPGTEFGGGMEFAQPGGIIRSPNITFDKTGLSGWTAESFANRFKAYADSSYQPVHLRQGDLNSPMPWTMYAKMQDKDLRAIYAYLNTLKPIENKVVRETKL